MFGSVHKLCVLCKSLRVFVSEHAIDGNSKTFVIFRWFLCQLAEINSMISIWIPGFNLRNRAFGFECLGLGHRIWFLGFLSVCGSGIESLSLGLRI